MSRSLHYAHVTNAFMLLALWFAAGTLGAAPPQGPQRGAPRQAPAPSQEEADALKAATTELSSILVPGAPKFDDAEAAGLLGNRQVQRLNLEQAYTLALIRTRAARSGKGEKPTLTLEPKRLAEVAEQYHIRDFERFRQDFLSTEGFDDPFAGYVDLLVRVQEVENARRYIATLTRYFEVLRELARGETSGSTRRQIDQIDAWLQRAYNSSNRSRSPVSRRPRCL